MGSAPGPSVAAAGCGGRRATTLTGSRPAGRAGRRWGASSSVVGGLRSCVAGVVVRRRLATEVVRTPTGAVAEDRTGVAAALSVRNASPRRPRRRPSTPPGPAGVGPRRSAVEVGPVGVVRAGAAPRIRWPGSRRWQHNRPASAYGGRDPELWARAASTWAPLLPDGTDTQATSAELRAAGVDHDGDDDLAGSRAVARWAAAQTRACTKTVGPVASAPAPLIDTAGRAPDGSRHREPSPPGPVARGRRAQHDAEDGGQSRRRPRP